MYRLTLIKIYNIYYQCVLTCTGSNKLSRTLSTPLNGAPLKITLLRTMVEPEGLHVIIG